MIVFGPIAVAENRVMGLNNKIPWNLKDDMKMFKQLTLGKTILMGRKTFESLGGSLPYRKNLVLTRGKGYNAGNEVTVFNDIKSALKSTQDDILVIGGADVLAQVYPYCTLSYVTYVRNSYHGDTFFPNVSFKEWAVISKSIYPSFIFKCYMRNTPDLIL